jgi:hypothetical protein
VEIEVRQQLFFQRADAFEYVLSDPYYSFDVIQAGHCPLTIDSFQYMLMSDNGILSLEP